MFTLIENGDVYTPEPIGRTSVLLSNSVIAKIGDIDRRALDQLVLSQGDRFDLRNRVPQQMQGQAAKKLPEKEEEKAA